MTSSIHSIKLGITRLLESEECVLRNMRAGLIANSASVNEEGTPTASLLLDAGIELACLLSPEHGYDTKADAGARVSDTTDPATGLPVYSLYGELRKPTPEIMDGIDALVFDLQDVGVRCYTYIWTMALAMQAAAVSGKMFVVLDRPNPLGGLAVQGPLMEPDFESFLGMYPIPMRHGMTAGELASMFNQTFEVGCRLTVIRMDGWGRRILFPDTGLEWKPPSPALGSPESAFVYAGTCLFEGVNLSEGRGTESPFRLLGAPWLDTGILDKVGPEWLDGFRVSPREFAPTSSKYSGKKCAGFTIDVLDWERADPVALSVELLAAVAARHENEMEWNDKHFDAVAGTDRLRLAILDGTDPQQIIEGWQRPLAEFEKLRTKHLLYKD